MPLIACRVGLQIIHHFGIADKNFSMQYAQRTGLRNGTVWSTKLVSYVDKNTKYGMILPPQLFYFLRSPGPCRGFAFLLSGLPAPLKLLIFVKISSCSSDVLSVELATAVLLLLAAFCGVHSCPMRSGQGWDKKSRPAALCKATERLFCWSEPFDQQAAIAFSYYGCRPCTCAKSRQADRSSWPDAGLLRPDPAPG